MRMTEANVDRMGERLLRRGIWEAGEVEESPEPVFLIDPYAGGWGMVRDAATGRWVAALDQNGDHPELDRRAETFRGEPVVTVRRRK